MRWEELKQLMLKKFRPKYGGLLHQQWLTLSQTGTVEDYLRQFIEFLAPLLNIPEEIAMGTFLKGLKEEIRTEVRMNPTTMDKAMELAIQVEEKLNVGLNRSRGTISTWAQK